MSEQKKNIRSSNPEDVAARLVSSINNVGTLPKVVYKGNDALRICENLNKGENKPE